MIGARIPSDVAQDVAEMGRFAAVHGWVPATSGNFSRRIDEQTIAITRSGADKGALTESDLIVVDLEAPLPAGVSAETPLHVARYRRDRTTGAVMHVHSVAATVLSRLDARLGSVDIEGFEMQKALAGVMTHEGRIRIPVFANAQDTQALAEQIEESIEPSPEVPAYLLAGHGMYAWGATMLDARRHLEGLEFLLRCALEERRIRA